MVTLVDEIPEDVAGAKHQDATGRIGTSSPVFGFRPIRWPLLRTEKLPNEEIFTVSPFDRA